MTANALNLEDLEKGVSIPSEPKRESKIFEIFKGFKGSAGRIVKRRLLGQAVLFEGAKTYHVFIKTLTESRFFLLPENRNPQEYDYAILTRELSKNDDRKYYWHSVGQGNVLVNENQGLMKLNWDFFGAEDIYMNLRSKGDELLKGNSGGY